MTLALNRAQVDRITTEARQANVALGLLAVLAFIPFAIGWVLAVVVTAIGWVWAAFLAGWREIRPPTTPESG